MTTPTRSLTGATLALLLAGLVVLTVMAAAGVVRGVSAHSSAARLVRDRAVPAVWGVAVVRYELVSAHAAAARNVRSGAVHLTGPGDEFHNHMALAQAALAGAAEADVAGEPGRRRLGPIDSLLIVYVGAVEQATGALGQPGREAVGTADLFHASQLLYTTVLGELDGLATDQRRALAEAVAGVGDETASWALPGVALVALLVGAQGYTAWRFRRVLNPFLLGATAVVVIALVVVAGPLQAADDDLATTVAQLDRRVGGEQHRTAAAIDSGREAVQATIGKACPVATDCGVTVAGWFRATPGSGGESPDPAATTSDPPVEDDRSADLLGAGVGWGERTGAVGVVAVAVLALVLGGLWPRLDEHRFRSS